jgi:hypothetical protein
MVRLFASPGAATTVVKKHPCLPQRSNRIPERNLKIVSRRHRPKRSGQHQSVLKVANPVANKEMRQS